MVLFGCLLAAIATWWSGSVLGAAETARGFSHPGPVGFVLLMVLGLQSCVVAHEAGHWAAGMAVGWKGLRLRMGPCVWTRAWRGWRLRWVTWNLGGAVTFAPTSHTGFRKAEAIFTAGGPAASLLFGLVCAAVTWRAKNQVVFWVFGAMARWSWIGVLALLPTGKGLLRSDGYWLLQLMRGGPDLERVQRYWLINMSLATELRPRDWPRSLMEPLLDGPAPSADRHDNYLAYKHLMDRGDPQAAFPWLAAVLKDWQKTDPPEYALEAAYYAAAQSYDAVLAARWLACAGKDVEAWVRLRAGAAVAYAEGRADEGRKLRDAALAALDGTPPSGYREYETARLDDLAGKTTACVSA